MLKLFPISINIVFIHTFFYKNTENLAEPFDILFGVLFLKFCTPTPSKPAKAFFSHCRDKYFLRAPKIGR